MNKYKQRAMMRLFDDAVTAKQVNAMERKANAALNDLMGHGRIIDNTLALCKRDYERGDWEKAASGLLYISKHLRDKVSKEIEDVSKLISKLNSLNQTKE